MNKKIIICLWILFLCTNILQAKIYNVKDFGAVGDGQHIDSEAINQAIVQAAREGGGNNICSCWKICLLFYPTCQPDSSVSGTRCYNCGCFPYGRKGI